jgi:DNA-binding transcriptional regulator YhcF (GntR family)
MTGLPLWDVCANRHKGNAESKAANAKVSESKTRMQRLVLFNVEKAGDHGLTCKELAGTLNVGMNAISGRWTELKAAGLIEQIGRRDGCGVYVIKKKED